MPRFFFHARSRDGFTKDQEGQELPDREAAQIEALAAAQQLWSDLSPNMAREDLSIEVTNEAGETILTVPFPKTAELLAKGSEEPLVGNGKE